MRCPKCGLENPESAVWCDCGYDFTTGKQLAKKASPVRGTEASISFNEDFFSFRTMVSPTILKVVYILGMAAITLAGAAMLFAGIKGSGSDQMIALGSGLGLILIGNLLWRIICESAMLLFSIHGLLRSIETALTSK
jgi:hypothetical protein